MQKNRVLQTFIATFLLITIAVPFITLALAEEEPLHRPIPGWKREAPGPWLHSGYGGYDETSNRFNPYSTAPNTPHILWKKQVNYGGVVGGETGESFFLRGGYPIVFGGRVFYLQGQMRKQAPAEGQGGYSFPGGAKLISLDQYTGEEIYAMTLPGNNSFASTLFAAFDTSWRGHTMSQTIFASGNGGIWAINAINGETTWYINLQNAKIKYYKVEEGTDTLIGMWWEQGAKQRKIVAYNIGEEGRITSPNTFNFGSPDPERIEWEITQGNPSHIVLSDGVGIYTQQKPLLVKGFNITTGENLWTKNITWTGPITAANGKVFVNFITDEYIFEGEQVQEIAALDVFTGDTIWETNVGKRETPFYGFGHSIAYGKVYAPNYDGHIYCFNETNGELVWKYYAGDNDDYLYGNYPFHMGPAVADGKVFIASEDNAPPQPMVAGNKLYALDADTGNVIWSFPGAGGGKGQEFAIADGMLFFTDTYTGQMFSFAKGPTAIEVSTKKESIEKGDYVWITGKVTDQSPAQKDAPVVSDDSMEAYMAYLHGGFPKPEDVTGVPIALQAEGRSGNIIPIGETTSDELGYFNFKWTPPDEDLYQITATFSGDESYWSSSCTTDLAVGPDAKLKESVSNLESNLDQTTSNISTYLLALLALVVVAIVIALYFGLKPRK